MSGVSVSGKTVSFTISPAAGSADNVVVSYAVPALNALHDAAGNTTAAFNAAAANQTPLVAAPGAGSPAPVTAQEAPSLVSSSPDDGSTVRAVSTITLTATRSADWVDMSVTGPTGAVSSLPDGSGQTATWAFAPIAHLSNPMVGRHTNSAPMSTTRPHHPSRYS